MRIRQPAFAIPQAFCGKAVAWYLLKKKKSSQILFLIGLDINGDLV
jgi:hypothetical protein